MSSAPPFPNPVAIDHFSRLPSLVLANVLRHVSVEDAACVAHTSSRLHAVMGPPRLQCGQATATMPAFWTMVRNVDAPLMPLLSGADDRRVVGSSTYFWCAQWAPCQDEYPMGPVRAAMRRDRLGVVRFAITLSDTPVATRDRFLREACFIGCARVVDGLLRDGADPNEWGTPIPESRFSARFSPLVNACWAGHVEVAQRLLEAGALPCQQFLAPMRVAVQYHHTAVVQLLLATGQYLPQYLYQAMHEAIQRGFVDTLRALVQSQTPRARAEDLATLFVKAMLVGNVDTVQVFLDDEHARRAIKTHAVAPALDVASLFNVVPVVQRLIVDPDLGPTWSDDDLLWHVADRGHVEVVRLLLCTRKFRSLDKVSEARTRAIVHEHADMVRLLERRMDELSVE